MSASRHERLNDIHNEVMCFNPESQFEGSHFDAEDRQFIREHAARLVELMDEYDRLDALDDEATAAPARDLATGEAP